MDEAHIRGQEDAESWDSNGSLVTNISTAGKEQREPSMDPQDSDGRDSMSATTEGHPVVISVALNTASKKDSDINDAQEPEEMEGVSRPEGNETSKSVGTVTKRKSQSMEEITGPDQGKVRIHEQSLYRNPSEQVDPLQHDAIKRTHSDVQEAGPEIQVSDDHTECENTSESQSDLAEHNVPHSKAKPHICTECKKCFSRKSVLLSHKRSHTGKQKETVFDDKPPEGKVYPCTICETTFQSQQLLDVHSRCHTGEKTHKCTECGKTFAHLKNLKNHQKIHPELRLGSDTEDSQPSSSAGISKQQNSPSLDKKSEVHKTGARFYKTRFSMSWLGIEPFKGVIVPVENDVYSFRCLVCEKKVSCSHQGEFDVRRHITGKVHTALQKEHLPHMTIASPVEKKPSTEDGLARDAERKIAEFFAQHSLPLGAAAGLGNLMRECFSDSKIAQYYSLTKSKAASILKDPIALQLLSALVADMKSSIFSLCVGASNDQDTETLNPIMVRIFDFKQSMACCKFLDMALSKEITAEGIFTAVSNAVEKHSIPWENCIGFGMDRVSGNVGKENAIKTKVHSLNRNIYFMACPCHAAHDGALCASSAFCSSSQDFDIEEFLIDVYFWLDYSSKQKDLDAELCLLVDSDYRRMLKLMSVRWLGMSTCLDRLILQYDLLRAYFLSTPDSDRAGKARLRRLVQCFENPMTEIFCLFYQASLPAFVHFNLLLEREDPIIHLLYDAVIDLIVLLLSRAFRIKVVHSFKRNPDADLPDLTSDDCQLPDSSLYVGILVRGKLKNLLEGRDSQVRQQNDFFEAVRSFHLAAVNYALKVLPIHDEVLKHARVFNIFEKHKYGFESVLFMVERFNAYLKFTKNDLTCLEQEFVNYQVTDFEDLPTKAREEAAIRVNCSSGEVVSYRMDVIWFHLDRAFLIQGTVRSKFFLLSKIARLIFTLPSTNADGERVFSRVKKVTTKCNPHASLDGSLTSILMIQMNEPVVTPSFESLPPESAMEKTTSVTLDYNKSD